jgi:hypothetical protein
VLHAPSRGTHMTRIGRVSIMLLGLSISIAFSTAALAECARWNLDGEWTFVQSNNTSPIFTLRQTSTGLQGSAHCGAGTFAVSGSVDGESKGDQFKVTAYWNNETTGVYEGTIGPQGRISGRTHDAQHPNVVANWYSNRTATCADGRLNLPGDLRPVPQKPPVKAQGRVKLDPTGTSPARSTLTICQKAWQARGSRTSPRLSSLRRQRPSSGPTTTRCGKA